MTRQIANYDALILDLKAWLQWEEKPVQEKEVAAFVADWIVDQSEAIIEWEDGRAELSGRRFALVPLGEET
jgi:hypothetical protein